MQAVSLTANHLIILAANDGGRGDHDHGPPQNKEKKKNVKFGSNFSHLAPSQKNFGLIFRFYGHIQ